MFVNYTENQAKTKLQQLIDAITDAINRGDFKLGNSLPSVNEVSKKYQVSRDTVFKAYTELKRRGMIDSTPAKSYFVADSNNKVFLFLDSFSPFKDVLYNSLIKSLPHNYKVDLVFHHYNLRVFETVILDSIGKYNFYIIMNFNNEKISDVLRKLDPSKLLILDWGKYKNEKYSYVCQDFGEQAYQCFKEASPKIKKYRSFNYVYPTGSFHPETTWDYFKKFCKEEHIPYRYIDNLETDSIKPGESYLVFRQKDLVQILKFAKEKKIKISQDMGIIAYNDTPLYEVVENGITSISTNFRLMGEKAAGFILSRQKIQEIIKTSLILRNSL